MATIKTTIICESTNQGTDKKLIETLITKHSLLPNSSFKIETRGRGDIATVKDFLRKTLPIQQYIISKEAKNVLVIVDADDRPEQRFKEIKQCFDTQIFSVQRAIRTKLPKDKTKINVGIYLFPNNKSKGSLETLCLKTLKHTYLVPKLKCIDSYMKCIGKKDGNMTSNNKSKAKFRIFMATPKPDRYVDSIIESINYNSLEFKKLKDFIKQVK